MQRFIDIILSGIVTLFLFPILFTIAIVLRFTGENEIFYLQERIGLNGEKFFLYKFTTMIKGSETKGDGAITVHNDPRVLPFGKFLRKTKLNEMPQLFNVLKGDMSIIGPRPLIESSYSNYSDEVKVYINTVRPGLSGIGSIVFRDEESILTRVKEDKELFYKNHILPYKGELEIWYVKYKSLFLYFLLIFLTVWVIIFPKTKLYTRLLKNLPDKEY
jgi:lipopolysaccharide/colanic/teichoic acid biosynthesis glycosyltransferase